jgi:hypothetical protein
MEKLLLTRVTPRRECTSLSEAPEPSHAERIRTHISALIGTKQSPDRVYTQIVGHGYSCKDLDDYAEFESRNTGA